MLWATRVLSAAVVAAMLAAAFRLRGTLADAVTALASLPPHTVVAILACWAVVVVARGLLYRWSLAGSTLTRGVVLDQVGSAVGNSVPGGGVLSGMLRYRIGRSFRHGPDEMAVCLLAVGEAMSVARWLLVVAVLGASVAVGAGSGFDVAVLGSAALAVGASAAVWLVLSRDTRLSRRAVRMAQGVVDRGGRRIPALRTVEVAPFAAGLRTGAAWIVSARMVRLLGAAAVVTTGGAAIVVLGVQAVGGPDAPSTFDIVRVYLLARLAAGFSPTPGGVGVVEGALGAGLVAAGADPASALGGILVYRGLTYALPIATGSAAYLGWRRWHRRYRFDRSRHPAGRALVPAVATPGATLTLLPAVPVGQTGHHGTAVGGG
ncbi:MAG: lysylphosphatidylglycerol synthase domain-containing protein [Acidimicrobiales bacterium]|nr:lysylphosphatidylglycerol synthase domain-containing protein [Acidimicrobiales bacterium]